MMRAIGSSPAGACRAAYILKAEHGGTSESVDSSYIDRSLDHQQIVTSSKQWDHKSAQSLIMDKPVSFNVAYAQCMPADDAYSILLVVKYYIT